MSVTGMEVAFILVLVALAIWAFMRLVRWSTESLNSQGSVICSECEKSDVMTGASMSHECPVCRTENARPFINRICDKCSARKNLCYRCGEKVV